MIVKCERCETKFKIPDEKVTEKGVKVRCTKCQNTFRVTREGTPAPAAAPAPDPFALFGEAPDPAKKGVEITRPGFFKEGVEATKAEPPRPQSSVPWNSMDEDIDEDAFREPTRIARIPLPPESAPSSKPSSTPFEPPPAVPAARPGLAAPAAPKPASAPVAQRAGASVQTAEEPDPFFDIDLDAPAGPPPGPAEALRKTASVPPPATTPAGALALGPVRPSTPAAPAPAEEDPFAALDFGDLATAPVAAPAKPAPAPVAAKPAAPVAAAKPPAIPAPVAAKPAAAPPAKPPAAAAPAKPAAPAPAEDDPFAALDFGELSPAPAPVAAKPAPAPVAAKPAAPAPSEPLAPSEPDRSLFDIPGPGATRDAEEFKVSDPDEATTIVGRKEVIDLPPMPSFDAPPASSREVIPDLSGPIARPTGRPEDMGVLDRKVPGRARKATGAIINLAVATVLVVGLGAVGLTYLRSGRLDFSVLSPAKLSALISPSRPYVAHDISNGLYETKEGHPLFYVRGEVENRGGSAQRLRVRAALYDGDQRVKSQEGLAGAVPTPEQLHAIASTEAAAALRAKLDATAAPVAAGGRAPFVLVFQEYPAELDAFRLEVTVEPATETGASGEARK